jgi:hypothetical protein
MMGLLRRFVKKSYKLEAEDIRPLATGHGACYATDLITVAGMPVNYMYREAPDADSDLDVDSGWRFLAGVEDQAYMDDPRNLEIYDVNTLANYSPDIIPYLEMPYGTELERQEDGRFAEVEREEE